MSKGWYWVITAVQKKLGMRYFSGKSWKMQAGDVRSIREPFKVLNRIPEPDGYHLL